MNLAVYLPSYEDELLSSWVMRTCHANATSYYSLLWHHGLSRHAQTDIDQSKNDKLLQFISGELRPPYGLAGIRNQSLLPILEMERHFPHRSWIRGIDRRAFKWRAFQFCSLCLAEDDAPYFRINWRFDWHEICPIHRVSMPNQCLQCSAPIILHRVQWEKSHLAHCYKCGTDFKSFETNAIALSQEIISAVDGLYLIIEGRDEEGYAAVHFLEALLEQWRRVQGVGESVKALEAIGVDVDAEFANLFPAMFLATAAHQLWQLDKKLLAEFISDHRRWFNLVVRDFQCPDVMRPYYKSLKWSYELNSEIINKVANEVEISGWEATPARIARKIGCHVSRVEKLLK